MSREKEFLEYVLSSVLAMVGQSIYILADTYFVARGLGANGLAALNLAIPIYNFINGVGLMLGIGGAARFIVAARSEIRSDLGKFIRRLRPAVCLRASALRCSASFL